MKLKIMIKNATLKIIRFWLWNFDKNVLRYINENMDYKFVDSYVRTKAQYILTKDEQSKFQLAMLQDFIEQYI